MHVRRHYGSNLSQVWFRDRASTPDADPPDDVGEIIVTLEAAPSCELM
jgi:hypothetical protein